MRKAEARRQAAHIAYRQLDAYLDAGQPHADVHQDFDNRGFADDHPKRQRALKDADKIAAAVWALAATMLARSKVDDKKPA